MRDTLDPMTLYVLRHAIAEAPLPGRPDSARQVTGRGERKARRLLSHARDVGVRPATILTSPYVRAAQTALIAAEKLLKGGKPTVTQSLVPYSDVYAVWSDVRDHAPAGDVMVVGHNPLLSLLVTWSIGAREDSLWLKKSGLVALDVAPFGAQARAELKWLLTPKSAGR